jgi:Protein of unknown function (DUF3822)
MLHLRETEFEPLYAPTYHLRLSIGADGAAYIIKNSQDKVLAWESHAWESRLPITQLHKRLQGLVRQDAVLQHRYASISTSLAVGHTVLVPNDWFVESQAPDYFTGATGEDLQDQTTRYDTLPAYNIQAIYALPQALENAINTCFPQGKIRHSHSAIVAAAHTAATERAQLCVYVYVRSGNLTVAVAEPEKLWLLNTYSYQTTKDFLYFVLLAYQQLHLNAERTPLILAGELVQDSDIYRVLRAYIKAIEWSKPPAQTLLGDLAKADLQAHFLNDLLF